MKGHGLLERDGQRYGYRLTEKGQRVAAMFVLFHQRICGPLANSLFPHRPAAVSKPPAKIEVAYHQADAAIQKLVGLSQKRNADPNLARTTSRPLSRLTPSPFRDRCHNVTRMVQDLRDEFFDFAG